VNIVHGTTLFLTADLRHVEARHAHEPLMERAGLATATLARTLAADSGKPVLIFAGPGNNGGDAFVAARYLKQWFFAVTVVFAGDAARLPADAAAAFARWQAAGGATTDRLPLSGGWSLVIDGLFGIGLTRDITGRYADWISIINHLGVPVLAIDVPSGLDADTGALHGCCVRATHTLTFIGAKPGLYTLDGPDHCGDIVLDTLTLALDSQGEADGAPGSVLAHGAASGLLAARLRNTHKGTHGSVGIIGGAHGMVGAALLCGRAALKLGAGRVYVGLLARDAPLLDAAQPELMLRAADDVLKLDHLSCLALGPGLGLGADAAFYLRCALDAKLPLVIDADALNAIAADATLKSLLQQSLTIKVLTPHPAEAARLLASTTREVQADRIAAATTLAHEYQAHVVLKGAGSICASPGEPWRINTSGNPGMASAGMGDVLTGLIAALIAQGADAQRAMDAAVWLHGAAADACVADGVGPVGLSAGETIHAARKLYNAGFNKNS
jgi:ADP-dependent NAD(P)H-hydrate dehydratase / NAD(P)H-hydrate epimerase